MKLAAAQLASEAGAVAANIRKHQEFVALALGAGASLVLFPELSLTGYEPSRALDLTLDPRSDRLAVFQHLSDAHRIVICLGAPTLGAAGGVQISMFVFQPGVPLMVYSKQHLHSDELPYFVAGPRGQMLIPGADVLLAPAICYESLLAEHAGRAARAGAQVYLASVAKSAAGVCKAYAHYPTMAQQHNLCVLMANSVGRSEGFVAAGESAAWGPGGALLGRMGVREEGILLIDSACGDRAQVRRL